MISSFTNHKGRLATLILFLSLVISPLAQTNPDLASHDELDIELGRAIFEKLWVFSPASTKSSDGLGPLYNARSCQQCHSETHFKDGLPHSLVIQLGDEAPNQKGDHGDPIYGHQIQTFAYPNGQAEANISVEYDSLVYELSDNETVLLKQPKWQLAQFVYGELEPDTQISARVAPRITGLGWIDSISKDEIIAREDPFDKNQDGISGKANWIWNSKTKQVELGRFGWKASKINLNQQNLAALNTDIGVSSWLFPTPEGDCTPEQTACYKLAWSTLTDSTMNEASPVEANRTITDLLLKFTAAVNPPGLNKKTEENLEGRRLISSLNCVKCHTAEYAEVLNGYSQETATIEPYSDFLLHDMGPALADKRSEYLAEGKEWRTTPLWGLSAYLSKNTQPALLHDGRAASVMEAILWHGGEAEESKQQFVRLEKHLRQTLIDFVESL